MDKETWTCITHECDDEFCNCPDDCYTPCVDVQPLADDDMDYYIRYGDLAPGTERVTIDDDGSGLDPA